MQQYFDDLETLVIPSIGANGLDYFSTPHNQKVRLKLNAVPTRGDYYSSSWLIFVTIVHVETIVTGNAENSDASMAYILK